MSVGVGVVGAGTISTQYLRNLTRFPDLDVRYVADIDVPRAAAQAAAFDVPAHGDLDGLLADDSVAIVVNLTVPSSHVPVARAALAAGKHVWNEKPLGVNRAESLELLADARGRGLRVAAAPDTVLGAGIQTARRLVESGAIGRPLSALTLMQQPGPDQWHPNPDFLFQQGGGPLLDIGPYYLTTLVQLLGPIARVSATTSRSTETRTVQAGPRTGEEFAVTVPTHVAALYEFENGCSAQSVYSFESPRRRTLFELTGTDATLEVPDPNRFDGKPVLHVESFTLEAATSTVREIRETGSVDTRGTGVVELARAIAEGRPERASGELAYHVLDAMLATIEAGERHSPVEVSSTVDVQPPLPEDWNPRDRTL